MTRKEIITQKYKFTIRALTSLDWLESGELPQIMTSPSGFNTNPDPKTAREFYKFCITKAVIIMEDEGKKKKITGKEPFDCLENEVSWSEIPDPDVTELMNAILEFSKISSEYGDKLNEIEKKNNDIENTP